MQSKKQTYHVLTYLINLAKIMKEMNTHMTITEILLQLMKSASTTRPTKALDLTEASSFTVKMKTNVINIIL